MGEVIDNDLKFNSDVDKKTWINESTKWRLPYWDWALASNIPALFMPASVEIRVPAAADGTQPAPEPVVNPLYRYQLQENGVPKKMGDLPKPYTVDSVTQQDGTVFPVRTMTPSSGKIIDFLSGRSALVQADGALIVPTNRTGLKASTNTSA